MSSLQGYVDRTRSSCSPTLANSPSNRSRTPRSPRWTRYNSPHLLYHPVRPPFNNDYIQGVLAGYDQKSNVVLSDSKERVFSIDEGVEEVPLGLYLVKGDMMCVFFLSPPGVRPLSMSLPRGVPFLSLTYHHVLS